MGSCLVQPKWQAMKKNAETGELEVFHSQALADDLPSEDEVRFDSFFHGLFKK